MRQASKKAREKTSQNIYRIENITYIAGIFLFFVNICLSNLYNASDKQEKKKKKKFLCL